MWARLLFFLLLLLVLMVLMIIHDVSPSTTTRQPFEPFHEGPMVRKLCIYAYYEKDDEYKRNLEFFLTHGIVPSMHYLIVVNGQSSVSVPRLPHVRVVFRENTGFDFGGFAHGLSMISKDNYDYFFFVNSSVRGPYGYPKENVVSTWSDKFVDLFRQKDVHLVGCTINVYVQKKGPPRTHVQSYVFVLDREGLDLVQPHVFSSLTHTMKDTISEKEVGMSQYLLRHGWNISCLAKMYQGYDYRTVAYNFNLSSEKHGGDPCYQGAYFGGTLDAREVVFLKTNRGIPVSFFPSTLYEM